MGTQGRRPRAAAEKAPREAAVETPEVEAEVDAAAEDADSEGDVDIEIDVDPIDLDTVPLPEDVDVDVEVAAGADDEDLPVRQLPVLAGGRSTEALTALNVYLAMLKTVQILPMDEQAALAVRFQETGDKEAAARLVASNLRLVVKIAFQFRRQWADVMDLVSEGNLGLAEAIRKFDAERKIPFPSYARYWIRARILAFIQENKHLIHAGSRAARKLFWRLDRERRQLVSEGLEPHPKLIAERVGIREEDVRELAPILDQRAVSLDLPAHGDEDGRTRGDSLADTVTLDPEDAMAGGEVHDQLKQVFAKYRATLDEREQAIWDHRLMSEDPVRLEDLGDRFGVSKERVRQLEVRIKANLKDFVQRHLGSDVVIEALR